MISLVQNQDLIYGGGLPFVDYNRGTKKQKKVDFMAYFYGACNKISLRPNLDNISQSS